jgi:hypothetical protein
MRLLLALLVSLISFRVEAGLVEVPYPEFLAGFHQALNASKSYSALPPDGREVALRGGAAWFLNYFCKESTQLKSGENVFQQYGSAGGPYLTSKGNMYPHEEARMVVLGMLIVSTPGNDPTKYACRLSRDVVGK